MIVFRPHRATLSEAMAEAVSVPDLNALMAHIRTMDPTIDAASLIEFHRYGGDDERIGWKDTHIVERSRNGCVLGFCTFKPVATR